MVGVDACSAGWFTVAIESGDVTAGLHRKFDAVLNNHADTDRILVDIPIGLPCDERRQCDEEAKDLLGARGSSVFYTPCRSAIECEAYEHANARQNELTGKGLSQQAYALRDEVLRVTEAVGGRLDGRIRESHPELCFAALNGQPVVYSKSSARGRGLRMELLEEALDGARDQYEGVMREHLRKEVGRDDVLDAMALAVAARDEAGATAPEVPDVDQPRIYYPNFSVPRMEK